MTLVIHAYSTKTTSVCCKHANQKLELIQECFLDRNVDYLHPQLGSVLHSATEKPAHFHAHFSGITIHGVRKYLIRIL